MTDLADRPMPRFPAACEGLVASAMAATLDRWHVGPGDLALCGGARGADILFAELCLARGAQVRLLIALPEAEFRSRSLRTPDTGW
jgi:hypothetical protein